MGRAPTALRAALRDGERVLPRHDLGARRRGRALLDAALDQLVLPEQVEHVVHGVVGRRLLAKIQSIVWWERQLQRGSPHGDLVAPQLERLVEQDGAGEDAGGAAPRVQVGVDALLRHAVEQLDLLQAEHEVIDPAGQAADEEGLEVTQRPPREELPREADRRDEYEVMKVVRPGEAEAADHVVHVHRVDDRERPDGRVAKGRRVVEDARVEGVSRIVQNGADGVERRRADTQVGERVQEEPAREGYVRFLAGRPDALQHPRLEQEVIEHAKDGEDCHVVDQVLLIPRIRPELLGRRVLGAAVHWRAFC
mmetsp:Transcript_668/g.1740  ORF Transcript_668/g.1740 Transcript_668/m.1740 type:complete len:309 (+) Transcript_668:473-1399(+)